MIEQNDISIPRADMEYILNGLENAINLSISLDLQDRLRNLSKTLTKSKLTRMLELSAERLEGLLKEEIDEPEQGS